MEGRSFVKSVVLVSGAPGAGKSTLAAPLATELGFALLSKDVIKEQLHDSLGLVAEDPLTSSRRLGAAAMELLWLLARHVPQVVLEANFRPESEYERGRLVDLEARVVEVHCSLPPDEAARRYSTRAWNAGRHPTHVLREVEVVDIAREFPGPLGIGTVIEVSTYGPVDIGSLAAQVRVALTLG